jgi:hypothetical protein
MSGCSIVIFHRDGQQDYDILTVKKNYNITLTLLRRATLLRTSLGLEIISRMKQLQLMIMNNYDVLM